MNNKEVKEALTKEQQELLDKAQYVEDKQYKIRDNISDKQFIKAMRQFMDHVAVRDSIFHEGIDSKLWKQLPVKKDIVPNLNKKLKEAKDLDNKKTTND